MELRCLSVAVGRNKTFPDYSRFRVNAGCLATSCHLTFKVTATPCGYAVDEGVKVVQVILPMYSEGGWLHDGFP
jgi:hypothetical protein